jgi:hypothetical protein
LKLFCNTPVAAVKSAAFQTAFLLQFRLNKHHFFPFRALIISYTALSPTAQLALLTFSAAVGIFLLLLFPAAGEGGPGMLP